MQSHRAHGPAGGPPAGRDGWSGRPGGAKSREIGRAAKGPRRRRLDPRRACRRSGGAAPRVRGMCGGRGVRRPVRALRRTGGAGGDQCPGPLPRHQRRAGLHPPALHPVRRRRRTSGDRAHPGGRDRQHSGRDAGPAGRRGSRFPAEPDRRDRRARRTDQHRLVAHPARRCSPARGSALRRRELSNPLPGSCAVAGGISGPGNASRSCVSPARRPSCFHGTSTPPASRCSSRPGRPCPVGSLARSDWPRCGWPKVWPGLLRTHSSAR